MPNIEIDQATFDQLSLTARLMNRPVGSVVRLLVDRLAHADADGEGAIPDKTTKSTGPAAPGEGWVAVHKVFKNHRVDGSFNTSTLELRITTPPWSGKTFSSPTAAAIAVVEHFPSSRQTSNTNGRKFWRRNDNGGDLRSLVGER